MKIVHSLLHYSNVDPAQLAGDGSIPLVWAAMAGQKECCRVLAKCGGLSVEQLDDLHQLVPPAIQEELRKMQCFGCGRARRLQESFRACSRCKVARYCCKDCQKKHWKEGHKKECVANEEEKSD